ncbi:MAG: hypothetical protein NT154_31185 [Verrucomicrobia bacterium]|nr:hypothetical protein [Verrucomicrobiota bacterium]
MGCLFTQGGGLGGLALGWHVVVLSGRRNGEPSGFTGGGGRTRSVKPKHFIVGLGCLLLLGGVATWFVALASPQPAGPRSHGISVSLVGYTNVAAGIPAATYASTNSTTGRFAILRVRNPTRRDFFCYFGPVILRPGDGSTPDAIQVPKSQAGDFNLPPHATAIIAVPEPQITGKWQSVVVLCHRHSYTRWQWPLVQLAQKVGVYAVVEHLAGTDRNWTAVSPEIAR